MHKFMSQFIAELSTRKNIYGLIYDRKKQYILMKLNHKLSNEIFTIVFHLN